MIFFVPVNEGNALPTESLLLEQQPLGKLIEKWISRKELAKVGPAISEVEIRDALCCTVISLDRRG